MASREGGDGCGGERAAMLVRTDVGEMLRVFKYLASSLLDTFRLTCDGEDWFLAALWRPDIRIGTCTQLLNLVPCRITHILIVAVHSL